MNSSSHPDHMLSAEGKRGELTPALEDREVIRAMAMPGALELLGERCNRMRDGRCILVDLQVLAERTAAQVAVKLWMVSPVHWFRGIPVPAQDADRALEWLDKRVEESLEDLQVQDAEAHAAGLVQPEEGELRHMRLVKGFRIHPDGVLGAAVRLNGQPLEVRRVFFAMHAEGLSVAECMGLGMGTEDEVWGYARLALCALYGVLKEKRRPRDEMPGLDDMELGL